MSLKLTSAILLDLYKPFFAEMVPLAGPFGNDIKKKACTSRC